MELLKNGSRSYFYLTDFIFLLYSTMLIGIIGLTDFFNLP